MHNNFIPKPYTKEPISVRVDTEMLKFIDALALQHNTSRSALINRCIEFAVCSLKPDKESKQSCIQESKLDETVHA